MELKSLIVLKRSLAVIIAGASLGAALGCRAAIPGISTPGAAPEIPAQNATPVHLVTPKPLSTAADTISSNPQPTVVTLSFWMVEPFSPQVDLVAQQLAGFEAANPNIKVKVYLKKTSGQASILNYLKSARAVAPAVLPDVIVLSTDQLPQAWRSDLIQPLDGKLDRTIVQDLLPSARSLGTVDDQLAGVPFELNVEHLVYNTGQITTTPVLWTDVLSSGLNYQFPAKGQNGLVNDASIIQYLSAGGRLLDDDGAPTLDQPALQAMLDYYRAALDRNIIDPRILEAGQPADLWASFLADPTGMINIDAHSYLMGRRLLHNTQATAIPTQEGQVVTVGRGWAFALVTKDPSRQNHALKLIETFLQTDVNAAWATRSSVIPTRQAAFALVAEDDPYWAFLDSYLQTTVPPPLFAGYDQLGRILQQAVVQVISGDATPAEAAEAAVTALNQ